VLMSNSHSLCDREAADSTALRLMSPEWFASTAFSCLSLCRGTNPIAARAMQTIVTARRESAPGSEIDLIKTKQNKSNKCHPYVGEGSDSLNRLFGRLHVPPTLEATRDVHVPHRLVDGHWALYVVRITMCHV